MALYYEGATVAYDDVQKLYINPQTGQSYGAVPPSGSWLVEQDPNYSLTPIQRAGGGVITAIVPTAPTPQSQNANTQSISDQTPNMLAALQPPLTDQYLQPVNVPVALNTTNTTAGSVAPASMFSVFSGMSTAEMIAIGLGGLLVLSLVTRKGR